MDVEVVKTQERIRTIDLVRMSLFATLMMIGANITSFVPFLVVGGVPITLQTFFAVLAGTFLGKRKGAIAMVVYILIGLVGAPVFARFQGGPSAILSPNFGFLLSFIGTAYIAGYIIEKKSTLKAFIVAALVSTLFNYIFGTNWMYMAYKLWFAQPEGFSYSLVWLWMAVPFPKDIALAIVAGSFAHRMRKVVKL